MPNILVCFKWVLDEQDIKVRPADLSLDSSRAKGKISDFDRNAIEAAVGLVEAQGGRVDALTFGGPSVKNALKDVLSRGADRVLWIADPLAETADAFVTAHVLAAAIRQHGPYDLVLCGEGSSDAFNQQLPVRLAALLDQPCLSFAQTLELQGDRARATRKLGDSVEEAEAGLPAVASVLGEMNKPRIPTLKQVLGAAKKPQIEVPLSALGLEAGLLRPRSTRLGVRGFVMNRRNIIFKEPDAAANVARLAASLASEGLC